MNTSSLYPENFFYRNLDFSNTLLGALKGNQSGLLTAVQANFQAQETVFQLEKGHGRIEKRTISISHDLTGIPEFPGLRTLIQVESERQVHRSTIIEVSTETRYYVTSLLESVQSLADRVRGYWGVENKVHHVRDVTQGEDASRIRTAPLIQIWAVARNFALNIYRDCGFTNMAQAQRMASFTLNTLRKLFRMK